MISPSSQTLFLAIFYFLCISFVCSQEDEQVESYSKTNIGQKAKQRRGSASVSSSSTKVGRGGDASFQFAVQAQAPSPSVGQPCDEFSDDPCKCDLNNQCEYDEFTEKCVSANPKFLGRLTCQREGAYYAYSSEVLCKASAGEQDADCKGSFSGGTSVYSVNLNGPRLKDSKGIKYKPDTHIIKLDYDRLNVPGKASCEVTGADPKDALNLYGTFMEGNTESREQGSCVSYPIPLLQDGEHELVIKTLAEAGRCLDIKMGGATVVVDADLMKVVNNENCKAIDIVIQFLVENEQEQMHIKGHQSPVAIGGGFSLKLCYADCDDVPDSIYRASAFSLIRYGNNTKIFENLEISIQTYGDGAQLFMYTELDSSHEKRESSVNQGENQQTNQPQKKFKTGSSAKTQIQNKIETEFTSRNQMTMDMKIKLRQSCPAIDKSEVSKCKKSGCEYDLAKEICDSAETFCSGAILGTVECFRGESFYITGGVVCQTNPEDQGVCTVGEVKYSVNIFGNPYQGANGIDFSSGIDEAAKMAASNPNIEFIDLNTDPGTVCKKSASGILDLSGAGIADLNLYSNVVRAKKGAPADNCLNFPISNVGDGSYELSINTIEPFYEQGGKRAFTVKINDQIILKNFDIAEYVGSCYGLALIVQFEVVGEDVLVVTGFPQGTIQGNTINLSFCHGDDTEGYEDLGYVVGAIYLAKLKVPGENDNPLEDNHHASKLATESKAASLKSQINAEAGLTDAESEEFEVVGKSDKLLCPECNELNGNPQGCKEAGFEYNLENSKCVKQKPDCSTSPIAESGACRKPGVFYVDAGVPCKSRIETGPCEKAGHSHGFNLGVSAADAGVKHQDSNGFKYTAEGKFAKDPDGTREELSLEGKCPEVKNVSEADAAGLFGSYISGKGGSPNGACITYQFPICQEGSYQLSLQTIETPDITQRCFDIKIEDIPIMVGVDTVKLSQGESCTPVRISFPITVENYGTPDNQVLAVSGIPDMIFVEKKFNVRLCNCEWNAPNPVYQASALSFTRFGEGTMACDACSVANAKKEDCIELGCDYSAVAKQCTSPVPEVVEEYSNPCEQYSDNPNACTKEGCQYNLETNTCELGLGMGEGAGICKEDEDLSAFANCRRPNAYYSNAGSLCLNQKDTDATGACGTAKPVWAVNLNGKDFTNSRGTLFSADEPLLSFDPSDLRVAVNIGQYCEDKDVDFEEFYSTGIQGNSAKKKSGNCLNYPIPICQDGAYELSLFLVDGHYDSVNQRCFDVKLNSATVAYSVDPARLGAGPGKEAKKCQRSELIILFTVGDSATSITPYGYSKSVPMDGNVHLSICYGKCGYADPVFQLSGFSVLKFPNADAAEDTTCDKCSIYHRNPSACEKDACSYDASTKLCSRSELAEACMKFSENPCDCTANHCRYDPSSGKCVIEEDLFFGLLQCRRPSSNYAFSSKVFCKYPNNDEAKAVCKSGSTVYGLNANGKNFEDSEGLKYKGETAQIRLDPSDVRKAGDTKGKLEVVGVSKKESAKLYGTFVLGTPAKQRTGATLSYVVPLTQDGEYELIIKMFEPVYKQEKKRVFDIKINNIPVATEVDLVKLGGGVGLVPVDISVLFLVQNSVSSLQIKGHTSSIHISGGFHLQFTYGANGLRIFDKSFIFSAFTLVRFGEDTQIPDVVKYITFRDITPGEEAEGDPCEVHGENVNDCVKDGCGVDLVNKKCLTQAKDCPETMFKKYSKCQRGGAMYGNAGTLCRNKVNGGICTGETMLAVNLNGEEFYYSDREILFEAEKPEHSQDEERLRKPSLLHKFCRQMVVLEDELNPLLMTTINAGVKKDSEGCITFPVKLKGDGRYELSFWTVDGKYKAPNQRCFDVKLNNVTVLYAVDPYRVGGRPCAKNEFIVLFKVKGSQMLPHGYKSAISIKGDKLMLSFCMGKCGAKDNSFQLSAFSVIKFGEMAEPSGKCKAFGAKADECKSNGCEFDLNQRLCIDEMKDCDDKTTKEAYGCLREDAFYVKSGMLCKNKKKSDAGCNSVPVYAVNLGSTKDYTFGPRRIDFHGEKSADSVDPNNLRVDSDSFYTCKNPDLKKDKDFKNLFAPAIYGEDGFEGCMSYPIAIQEDGQYELSIWTIDKELTPNYKCWDIGLNGETVVYSIDPARMNNGVECAKNELIILFKVQNSVTQLIPAGFSNAIILKEKSVDVKFCMGTCSYAKDKTFQISAISLLKVLNEELPPEVPCESYGSDIKGCKRNGCEFDLTRKWCVFKRPNCTDEFFEGYPPCRRFNSYYVKAGIMCKTGKENDKCLSAQVKGINCGDASSDYEHIDANVEASLKKETTADYVDENNVRVAKDSHKVCTSSDGAQGPWASYVQGSREVKEGCLTYPLPIDDDGFFELSLWTFEGDYSKPQQRCFDIMLNFKTVVYGLDPLQMDSKPCTRQNIVIMFKVEGGAKRLFPNGFFDPIELSGGKVDLKICQGSCGYPDTKFRLSAINLRKLWFKERNPCEIHGSNAKACKLGGCQFNLAKRWCVNKAQSPAPACDADVFEGLTNIHRKDTYYVKSGLLCLNNKNNLANTKGDTFAVNLGGGEDFHFEDGETQIQFRAEIESDYVEIPNRIRKTNDKYTSQICDYKSWTGVKAEVFGKFIFGTGVNYPIPLSNGDGVYEIAVWTLEGWHSKPAERCFDILLNNQTVVYGLDMLEINPEPCTPLHIVILVKVEEGVTKLYPNGFTEPIELTEKKVDLGFGMGSCGYKDPHFHACAIYSMKHNTEPASAPPPSGKGKPKDSKCSFQDKAECRKAGCQFDLGERVCTDAIKACTDDDFPDYTTCRRHETYYINSGVICKNSKATKCYSTHVKGVNLGGSTEFAVGEVTLHPEVIGEAKTENYARKASSTRHLCDVPDNSVVRTSHVYSDSTDKGASIGYPVPIYDDGNYELTIWLQETAYSETGKRCFDIRINGHTIAYAVDIVELSGGKCREDLYAANLAIFFKVEGGIKKLYANGFSNEIAISGNKIFVEFCQGSCGFADESFQVIGFYVKKIWSEQRDPCENHGRNHATCKAVSNCHFDYARRWCMNRYEVDNKSGGGNRYGSGGFRFSFSLNISTTTTVRKSSRGGGGSNSRSRGGSGGGSGGSTGGGGGGGSSGHSSGFKLSLEVSNPFTFVQNIHEWKIKHMRKSSG